MKMKKNILIYTAVFEKEESGMYSVYLPDFNQATCGEGLADAMFMAEDLLGGLAVYYEEDGMELPKPTNIMKVKFDDAAQFKTLIKVDLEAYKEYLKTLEESEELNDDADDKE